MILSITLTMCVLSIHLNPGMYGIARWWRVAKRMAYKYNLRHRWMLTCDVNPALSLLHWRKRMAPCAEHPLGRGTLYSVLVVIPPLHPIFNLQWKCNCHWMTCRQKLNHSEVEKQKKTL